MKINKSILITRHGQGNKIFRKRLLNLGIKVYEAAPIRILPSAIKKKTKKILKSLIKFDWIIFTSANGVKFFFRALKKLKINIAALDKIKIAAVGIKTAEDIKKHKIKVKLIPSKYLTGQIADEIGNIRGLKILLARTDIASKLLDKKLKAMGAKVTNISIYKTRYSKNDAEKTINLIKNKKIDYLSFTSPSTLRGFIGYFQNKPEKRLLYTIPVLSIGPITTAAATKAGFQKIYTAEKFTTDGIIDRLKKLNR